MNRRQRRPRLTRDDLADLVGDRVGRVQDLTDRGVVRADEAGRYAPGDADRILVIDLFEAAGMPLDVLVPAGTATLQGSVPSIWRRSGAGG